MRLPEFDYLEPRTIKEACSLLQDHKENARIIAGGTDLLANMKLKTVTPRALVNIKRISNLNYIECNENEGLSIGALTTAHTIGTSPVIKERFGILAQAAGSIGTPQVRQTGTLGGNICLDSRCFYYNRSKSWRQSRPACYHTEGDICYIVKGGDNCQALFVADIVPALIALDATLTIASPSGDQHITLEDIYTGRGNKAHSLQPGQVVTDIHVPDQPLNTGGAYLKFSLRETIDFAIFGVAVKITLEPGSSACRDSRIVLIGVAPGPVRAVETERVIKGREIDHKLVKDVGQALSKEIHPITHMGISAGYKRRLVKSLTERGIEQAWLQAQTS